MQVVVNQNGGTTYSKHDCTWGEHLQCVYITMMDTGHFYCILYTSRISIIKYELGYDRCTMGGFSYT